MATFLLQGIYPLGEKLRGLGTPPRALLLGILLGTLLGSLLGLAGARWWRLKPAGAPFAQGQGLQPSLAANTAAARRCARLLGTTEVLTLADPSNYGERRRRDQAGGRVPAAPSLVVLHETVLSLPDTLRLFQTPHPRDADQASYHLLIANNGTLFRLVPDQKRAFGAGWSAWGDATIRHRLGDTPLAAGSINNVALHVSLESPVDGRGDGDGHAGYSTSQYRSLAQQVLLWQLRWGIPMRRVSTHNAVDRSHSRRDPRSFRWERFDQAWRQAAQRCGVPERYGLEAR